MKRAACFILCGFLVGAIAASAAEGPPPMGATQDAWPMTRGCMEGTGRSAAVFALPLAERWHRGFDKTAFEATPVIADATIYVGDLDGTFHALALDTGETRWSFKSEAGFSAAAAVAHTRDRAVVVAGDGVGMVRAFDAKTGDVAWTYECEGEISGGPGIRTTAEGPQVLVGSQDASLSCLDAATGRLLWKHSITDQIRCMPTITGGRVLIAGCDGRLHVIDADAGKPVGEVPIDGPTGTTPAGLGTAVFFGSEGGTFWCIDVGAGPDTPPSIRWQKKATGGNQAYRSSAAIGDGPTGPLAIVGTRGRAVEAFSTADGSRCWRTALRGRVDGSPVVVGAMERPKTPASPVAIVGDAAGRIVALRTADGSVAWEFDAGNGFTASPAVAGGRIVLASEDGTVWCFGSSE